MDSDLPPQPEADASGRPDAALGGGAGMAGDRGTGEEVGLVVVVPQVPPDLSGSAALALLRLLVKAAERERHEGT